MNHRTHLTLLALAGTLLGATVAAGAQSSPAPIAPTAPTAPMAGHHHAGIMKRAMAGLNVTPTEMAQIKAAQQKFKASKGTATPETHAQLQSDVEAALTPDQRTQFESNMTSLRAEMRAERKAGTAPVPSAT